MTRDVYAGLLNRIQNVIQTEERSALLGTIADLRIAGYQMAIICDRPVPLPKKSWGSFATRKIEVARR
jgi:hypothetical protein